jgi:hypothetical protein
VQDLAAASHTSLPSVPTAATRVSTCASASHQTRCWRKGRSAGRRRA